MLNGSLVAPAYEASGAPSGGEVIPEPLWMGQTNRTGGGSGCLLPDGKLQPYVTMGACWSSNPTGGTITAFCHHGACWSSTLSGGKIKALPPEWKELRLGCVLRQEARSNKATHKKQSYNRISVNPL